jgi:hypothetical protein
MGSRDEEMVKVDYEYTVYSTTLAVLLYFPDVGEVWLPRSQIEMDEERKIVKMPEWLAYENELI